MNKIHVLCKTQFNLISDNDSVSWVQFYEIPTKNIKHGDIIYLYIDSTKSPYLRGIVLGIYKPSPMQILNNQKNKNRIGITFQIQNPIDKVDINNVSWPNGRAYGESWAIE